MARREAAALALVISLVALSILTCADAAPVTENAVVSDPANQYAADIYGRYVVWQDSRGGDWDIYLYDLGPDFAFNTSDDGGEMVVSDASQDQVEPAIHGRYIVWQDGRAGNYDIYLYDMGPDLTFNTTDDANVIVVEDDANDQKTPEVSDSWVVWVDTREGTDDVHAYNILTQEKKVVANGPSDQSNARIWNDRVVWDEVSHQTGTSGVHGLNLSGGTSFRLSEDTADEYLPDILGDRVVCTRYEAPGQHNVFLYDWETKSPTPLTSGAGDKGNGGGARISGTQVCWPEVVSMKSQLMVKDLSNGSTTQVTSGDWNHIRPALFGNLVAWQDGRNGNVDIYLAQLPDDAVPEIEDLTPSTAPPNATFTFSARVTDNGVVSNVSVEYWLGGNNGTNASMVHVGGETYEGSIFVPADADIITYRIIAVDLAGNSNRTVIKTLDVVDVPPMIKDMTAKTAAVGDEFVFAAEVTDDIGVERVWVEYWFDQDPIGKSTLELQQGSDGIYRAQLTVPDEGSSMEYIIYAKDSTGHVNTTMVGHVAVEGHAILGLGGLVGLGILALVGVVFLGLYYKLSKPKAGPAAEEPVVEEAPQDDEDFSVPDDSAEAVEPEPPGDEGTG